MSILTTIHGKTSRNIGRTPGTCLKTWHNEAMSF